MSRQNAVLWAEASSRRFVNEPAELTLSRAGMYAPRPQTLRGFLRGLARTEGGAFLNTAAADEACHWVQRNGGAFPSLRPSQAEAIRAYTLEQPPYYAQFNGSLFACTNGSGVGEWADFLDALDSGLSALRDGQAPPDRLYRLAWIPDDVFRDHFAEDGHEIVLRAPTSTSEETQWAFLNKAAAETAGKKAALLEFDADACRFAADVQGLSWFAATEKEWLLPPFFRGVVRAVGAATSPAGQELPRIRIGALPELPPAAGIRDHERVPDERVLDLALLLALHGVAAARDGLERVEEAVEKAAVVARPEAVGRIYLGLVRYQISAVKVWAEATKEAAQEGRYVDAAVGGIVTMFAIPGATIVKAANMATRHFGHDDIVQCPAEVDRDGMAAEAARREEEVQRQHEASTTKARETEQALLDGLEAIQQLGATPPVEDFLRQVRIHGARFRAAPSEKEKERLLEWLRAALGAKLMAQAIAGSHAALRSPFPLKGDPLRIALEVGDAVFADTVPSSPEDAARYAVARLMHLRLSMSRLRMLVPVGVPDAGKSTLLKSVLDVEVATGLAEPGRTQGLSFHPWPAPIFDASLRPAFVVDAPGFGDDVGERNDVLRLVASFAADDAFCEVLRVVRVLKSGRKDTRLDAMIQKLNAAPVLTVFTKVDANFRERCDEMAEKTPKPERAAGRRKIAEEILAEDREVSGDADPAYACVVGWGSPDREEEEEDDEEDCPPKAVMKDFKKYFQVLTRAELRQRLETFVGMGSLTAPPAVGGTGAACTPV